MQLADGRVRLSDLLIIPQRRVVNQVRDVRVKVIGLIVFALFVALNALLHIVVLLVVRPQLSLFLQKLGEFGPFRLLLLPFGLERFQVNVWSVQDFICVYRRYNRLDCQVLAWLNVIFFHVFFRDGCLFAQVLVLVPDSLVRIVLFILRLVKTFLYLLSKRVFHKCGLLLGLAEVGRLESAPDLL